MNEETDERLRSWLPAHFGTPDISERLLEYHQDFMPDYGSYYKELVGEIYPALEEIPVHNPYFTDHGSRHTARVIDNIALLCDRTDLGLNPAEKYLLAASAWLHDVGMSVNRKIHLEDIDITDDQNIKWFNEIGTHADQEETIDEQETIRKWHHVLSWHFTRKNHDRLGFPGFLVANCVAEICRFHRRGTDITDLDQEENLDIGPHKPTIHLRSIAAIFQFADALDTNKNRAPGISSYVQALPEESQKHWQACQLINGYEYDNSNNTLVFKASHTTPPEEELLRDKMAHLYEEYEDIWKTIISEPHKLVLNDIRCKSYNENALGSAIEISGLDEYYKRQWKENKETVRKGSEKFEQEANKWNIDIHNTSGDATVERTLTLSFLDDEVTSRNHFVRSFDTSMTWDWSEDIRATDTKGRELRVEKVDARPNNKEFTVHFPRDVDRSSQYTYTYSYYWEGLFPMEEERYTITGNSEETEFYISPPEGWNITEVSCEEIAESGVRVLDADTDIERKNDKYHGVIQKQNKFNNVRIIWDRS